MHSVIVRKQSVLPIAPPDMWQLLLQTDTLKRIGDGFVTYKGTLPKQWQVGVVCDIRPKFTKLPWLILPTGRHMVEVKQVNSEQHQIETIEAGGVVKKWSHFMNIHRHRDKHKCIYVDTIVIEAGLATKVVAMLANSLYQHRHERLKTLL